MRACVAHQVGCRLDYLYGFGQGGGHGSELVADLLRGHVLQERPHRRVFLGRVVQVRPKTQGTRRVVNSHLIGQDLMLSGVHYSENA